jgi:hypothetical protein
VHLPWAVEHEGKDTSTSGGNQQPETGAGCFYRLKLQVTGRMVVVVVVVCVCVRVCVRGGGGVTDQRHRSQSFGGESSASNQRI